jgi:ribosomal protein L33
MAGTETNRFGSTHGVGYLNYRTTVNAGVPKLQLKKYCPRLRGGRFIRLSGSGCGHRIRIESGLNRLGPYRLPPTGLNEKLNLKPTETNRETKERNYGS